jgi:hypothetical protein
MSKDSPVGSKAMQQSLSWKLNVTQPYSPHFVQPKFQYDNHNTPPIVPIQEK